MNSPHQCSRGVTVVEVRAPWVFQPGQQQPTAVQLDGVICTVKCGFRASRIMPSRQRGQLQVLSGDGHQCFPAISSPANRLCT